MNGLVKRLREASSSPTRDAMGIGEHWNLEDEAADEIERKDTAIAELTEALKRDVVDETRNAELNNAKDAAIDELVGALYACLPHLPTEKYYGARDVIAKYDTITKET